MRFEDFGAQDVPSREACLNAVEACDVYLLLLGPQYGYRFPETGQSATHDEWKAAQQVGLQIYVFRKLGITSEANQEEFAAQVGRYGAGRFYKGFETTEELQRAVVEAIREAERKPPTLELEPLSVPVGPAWIEQDLTRGSRSPLLEIHILPSEPAVVSDRVFHQAAQRLPALLRGEGLISQFDGLELQEEAGADVLVVATRSAEHSGWNEVRPAHFHGVRIRKAGDVSVLFSLTSDRMGSVLDRDETVRNLGNALRMVSRLDYVASQRCVVAVGLTTSQGVSVGQAASLPRSQSSMGFASDPVHLSPDESIPTAALDVGANELASIQVDALIRALK